MSLCFGYRGCGNRVRGDTPDNCGLYTLTQGKVVLNVGFWRRSAYAGPAGRLAIASVEPGYEQNVTAAGQRRGAGVRPSWWGDW